MDAIRFTGSNARAVVTFCGPLRAYGLPDGSVVVSTLDGLKKAWSGDEIVVADNGALSIRKADAPA